MQRHQRILGLVFTAVLAIPFSGYAAISFGVGPKLGLNMANASVDPDDGIDKAFKLCFGAGLLAEFGVTKPWSLQVEPMFLQRGVKADVEVLPGATVESIIKLNYLEIPILAKAKFGAIKSHAYVIAGPSLGILLSAKGEVDGDETDIKDETESFSLSGEIGAGGGFQLAQYVYLQADARYSYGFLDANSDSDIEVKPWDIRFMVGLLFHLTE
jgi:hypothetical protein